MKEPLVSVIMPLYNGISFIDNAVQSVLDQTYQHWELLIVDDGSKDESYQRAVYWENKDDRIKAFQHPNGANKGVSATRNLAINNSNGDFLALLDCDDKWVNDKLMIQVTFLLDHPDILMTYAKAQVIDEHDNPIHDPSALMKMGRPPIFGNGGGKEIIHFNDVIFKIWVPASTAFIRKESSLLCGNFDESLPVQVEDILLFTLIAEKGKIHFMDTVLLLYRVHSSQWNTKLNKKKKLYGKLLYLLHLVPKVNTQNNRLLSSTIIWDLYKEIVHYSVSFKKFDIKFVFEVLNEIRKNEYVKWYYNFNAVQIVAARITELTINGLKSRFLKKN